MTKIKVAHNYVLQLVIVAILVNLKSNRIINVTFDWTI